MAKRGRPPGTVLARWLCRNCANEFSGRWGPVCKKCGNGKGFDLLSAGTNTPWWVGFFGAMLQKDVSVATVPPRIDDPHQLYFDESIMGSTTEVLERISDA